MRFLGGFLFFVLLPFVVLSQTATLAEQLFRLQSSEVLISKLNPTFYLVGLRGRWTGGLQLFAVRTNSEDELRSYHQASSVRRVSLRSINSYAFEMQAVRVRLNREAFVDLARSFRTNSDIQQFDMDELFHQPDSEEARSWLQDLYLTDALPLIGLVGFLEFIHGIYHFEVYESIGYKALAVGLSLAMTRWMTRQMPRMTLDHVYLRSFGDPRPYVRWLSIGVASFLIGATTNCPGMIKNFSKAATPDWSSHPRALVPDTPLDGR